MSSAGKMSYVPKRRRPLVIASTVIVIMTLFHVWQRKPLLSASQGPISSGQFSLDTDDVQPAHIRKVMGLVFYGRRATVSILDCYLKRNLVKNGGVLDGVIFVERTKNQTDVAFLDNLIETEPDYVRWRVDLSKSGYTTAYDLVEDDVMYVKIDDDIIYIEDEAIRSLVRTKSSSPEMFIVSANVVNQPLFSWVHWNLGAVKPFLPELDLRARRLAPLKTGDDDGVDWRTSRLPSWTGPANFNAMKWKPKSPVKHRWLPVRHKTSYVLEHTPIAETTYDAFGPGWSKWQIGAQEHYSLLENIEKDELRRYHFHIWDFQYRRMGIQFIAAMGNDINKAKPIPADDEHHFAVTMPKRLNRRAVADGMAVVAHYSFSPQRKAYGGMESTDILERYRSLAKETACKPSSVGMSEAHNDFGNVEKKRAQGENGNSRT